MCNSETMLILEKELIVHYFPLDSYLQVYQPVMFFEGYSQSLTRKCVTVSSF